MTDKRTGYFHELASQFPNPENIRSITTDINGNVLCVQYWPAEQTVDLDELLVDELLANAWGDDPKPA